MPWSSEFDTPVPGFPTIGDAAEYITKLPKKEQVQPHWQFAADMLMKANKTRRLYHVRRNGDDEGAEFWKAGNAASATAQGRQEVSDRQMKKPGTAFCAGRADEIRFDSSDHFRCGNTYRSPC